MRIWLTLFLTMLSVDFPPEFGELIQSHGVFYAAKLMPTNYFFVMLIIFAVIYPLVNYFFLMLKAADKWLTERAKKQR